LVCKIFTFYINDVILFKCSVTGPKGELKLYSCIYQVDMNITISGLLALSTNLQPGTEFSHKMFELSINERSSCSGFSGQSLFDRRNWTAFSKLHVTISR